LGLDCVRRPTGGRAVWHARELTYAVAAPLAVFGGLRDAYHRIHLLLAAALQSLGASPELAPLAPSPQSLAPGPCFSAPVGGEVLLDRRKVIGSAQLRQGDAVLQHGSLLLEDDQSMPRSLAGLGGAENGTGEVPLSRSLGRRVSFEEAAGVVTASAEVQLGPLRPLGPLPSALRARVRCHAQRFQDPAWTWLR
ncbi:MAG TPA: hypothetical protein VGP61_13880, partial [Gemmatimonadales bacterium]|nr:hypothetical protein [Gemmatimonadales bacterium]